MIVISKLQKLNYFYKNLKCYYETLIYCCNNAWTYCMSK